MRWISIVVLSVAALFGFAAPAAAQGQVYPPRALVVVVSDGNPDPGASFDASVTGCAQGETFEFEFGGTNSVVTCIESSVGGLSLVSSSPSGNSATATFTAPLEHGVATGTVSFATNGALLDTFSVNVPSLAPANLVVANDLVGNVSWSPDLFTLLLLVAAGVAIAVVARLRLVNA